MNYGNHHAVFTNKVKEYDAHTDCHETLALHRDLPTDDPYYIKLWAEIDALRERQLALQKKAKASQ